MDGKRRGRAGFLKGKLMRSLYRATTAHKLPPSSTTVLHLPYAAIADQAGYMKLLNQQEHLRSSRPHQSYNNIPAHQVIPQLPTHTRSVSYYTPTPHITNKTAVDSYSATTLDTLYGGAAVDEEVDLKAAKYISSVRERFRLHYLN